MYKNELFVIVFQATVSAHWLPNDGFLYESTNRQQDGSVIHSIATFGEYLYPPESEVI